MIKKILILLICCVAFFSSYAQFPGTDSLRNFNNRWITNSAIQAFTNYRLNTLLNGMIDWIDSARAGEGGTIGVDSIGVLNDSTFRYRKNGVFQSVVIKGGAVQHDITLTGTGLSGSPLKVDTTVLKTVADAQRVTDSLVALIALKLNISDTAAMMQPLYDYIASDTIHIYTAADPSPDTLFSYKNGDSALVGYIHKGVTSISQGYGITNTPDPITTTGTVQADTLAMSTRAWRQKGDDSVAAVLRQVVIDTAGAIRADFPTGGGSSNLVSDLGVQNFNPLSQIKNYHPAKGVAASDSLTNYPPGSVDSVKYYFSSTRAGSAGIEYGGWLTGSSSGDSIRVTAPFWVLIGDSQAEGHTGGLSGLHGRVHPNGLSTFQWDYPDSAGQISYHLRALTNMRWYNHGIGSQTTNQVRIRFYRDVVGITAYGSNDGRGNTTLTRKPQGVVIIIGINDVQNGVPASVIKNNFEWYASVCQAEGIRCVILNLPGNTIATQEQLRKIDEINDWLATGVLDQYGASLVDYNSWWNNPAFGNDNVHPTTLIADNVHPTAVGYDSLSNYIYREAKLPKLDKAVFINEIAAGFSGYSRPVDITINGDAYSLSNSTDTISITTYVPDSVWIKINSSTIISGTGDSTGFSHIQWFEDNNPNNDTLYTRRTNYSGSQKSLLDISKIRLVPAWNGDGSNRYDVLDFRLQDTTLRMLQMRSTGGGADIVLNGLTNTALINNSTLSVYGGIGSSGNFYSTAGTRHRFGAIELMTNLNSTTAYGISGNNTLSGMSFQTNPAASKDGFLFTFWSGAGTTPLSGLPGAITNQMHMNTGFGNAAGVNQVANFLNIDGTINQTTSSTNPSIRGIRYAPNVVSLTDTRHFGLFQTLGNNYLNILGDSTCFGCDSTQFTLAKFRINGTVRLDGLPAGSATDLILVKRTDSLVGTIAASTFATQSALNDTAAAIRSAIGASGITSINSQTQSTQTIAVGNGMQVVSGSGTHTISLQSTTLGEGSYTPTATDITNIGARTIYDLYYFRVFNKVYVFGKIDIDPTSIGDTQIDLSLPIASEIGADGEASGTGVCQTSSENLGISGEVANNRVSLRWNTTDVTNQTFRIHFSYHVTPP